jgi:hypothetical protein
MQHTTENGGVFIPDEFYWHLKSIIWHTKGHFDAVAGRDVIEGDEKMTSREWESYMLGYFRGLDYRPKDFDPPE